MKTVSSLSIVLPCKDEEANVETVVRRAVAAGRGVTSELEVLVVDDASRDGTARIATALCAELPEVRVLRNAVSVGYGGALRTGFLGATKDWVFYTDGDGQFDSAELPLLVDRLSEFDIVTGYRAARRDGVVRELNGLLWTELVRVVLGLQLRDVNCAFKIYPRRLFDRIELTSDGALIDAEVLVQAQDLGYTIGEVAVTHFPREAGEQSGGRLRVIFSAFTELRELARRRRLREAPSAVADPG